jgi:capsid protein
VLSGALDLPDYEPRRREYQSCSWLPPKWDWVDPLRDARAEIEQIDAGLKSRSQSIAERGYDAEQVDAEIAADREREQALGLTFSSAATLEIGEQPDESQGAKDDGNSGKPGRSKSYSLRSPSLA